MLNKLAVAPASGKYGRTSLLLKSKLDYLQNSSELYTGVRALPIERQPRYLGIPELEDSE